MDHTASAGEELESGSMVQHESGGSAAPTGGREGTGGWSSLRRARSEEDMAQLKGEDQALYSGMGVDATSSPSLPKVSGTATAADVVSTSVGSDVEQGWSMHWNGGGRGDVPMTVRGSAKEQIPSGGGGGGALRQRVRLNKSIAAFRSYDGRKGPRDVMRSKSEQESLRTKLRLRGDSDDDDDDDDDDEDYDAYDGEDSGMSFYQRRTGAASGLSINETQFAADGGGVRSPMRRIMQAGGGGNQQQQVSPVSRSSSSLKKMVAFREKAKRKRNPLREFGKHPSIPHNMDRIEKLAKNAPRMVHPLGSDLPSAMKSHHGMHPGPHSPLAPLDRILYNEEDGMRIAGYCIGAKLQLKKIISHFLLNPKASTNLFRDCFHMRLEDTGEVFFFDYGVIICWNMLQEHEQEMIKEITKFGVDPPRKVESDHFIWFMGDDQMKKPIKIIGDFIILKDPTLKIRLAVSHALAQSTKLSVFEQEIEDLIENSQGYAVDLARYGKISMSREQLSMKMGELFLKKNAIDLHTDLLDKPEFFWEHKKLEPTYDSVHNYLDVGQRREVLNKRLGIVQELFEVLKSEKDSRHGVRLELVVIWLIVAEALLQILGIVSEWLLANKDIIL